MREKFLLLILNICLVFSAGAQDPSYAVTQILPPSPEAFSMTKYGDVPIGLITGTSRFNIPIYTINAGSLSHSVSLNYSSNGVKVDGVASRVGTDWTLTAGGVITRSINGLPDLSEFPKLKPANHSVYSEEFWSFLQNSESSYDTQPDIFTYNVNNMSGSFIIDNGIVKEIKHSGLKITLNSSGASAFTIIATNGDRYDFGGTFAFSESNSYPEGQFKNNTIHKAITGWYLTKITSAVGDIITFNYANELSPMTYYAGVSNTFYTDLPQGSGVYNADGWGFEFPGNTPPFALPELTTFSMNSIVEPVLSSIVFKHGSLNFKYSPREDHLGDKKLDSIKLIDNEGLVLKTFVLGHQYALNNNPVYYTSHFNGAIQAEYPYLTKRLFLNRVDEYGEHMFKGQSYEMLYNNMNDLPPRLSFSQDLFGYANGKANTKFFPNDTYIDYSLGGKRYGADRSFDFEHAKKGMLSKVIYPGKGSTTFVYEPNVAGRQTIISVKDSLKAFSMSNSMKLDKIVSDTISGFFSLNINIAVSWSMGMPPAVRGDEGIRVKVIDVFNDQVLVNNFLVLADHDQNFFLSNAAIVGAMGPFYQLNGRFIVSFESNFDGLDFYATVVGRSFNAMHDVDREMAGVRVRSVTNDDGLGNLSTKRYKYSKWGTAQSSGDIFNNPEGRFVNVERFLRNVEISGEMENIRSFRAVVQSNGVFDLYQTGFSGIQYDTVIELFGENGENGGIEHRYDVSKTAYPQPLNHYLFSDLTYHTPITVAGTRSSNTDYLNGQELFTGTFKVEEGGQRKFVEKKYNHYSLDIRKFNTDTIYAVKRPYAEDRMPISARWFGLYDISRYYIHHHWVHLDSTTTVTINGSDSVEVTKNYLYNNLNNYLPTLTSTRNSEQTELKQFNLYPSDMVDSSRDPSGIYSSMVAKNIIDPVVEQLKTIGSYNTQTSLYLTDYFEPNPGIFKPKSIGVANLHTNTIENRLSFHKYDLMGNLLSQSQSDGMKISYVWSYERSLPVVEIKHVDYDILLSTIGSVAVNTFSNLLKPTKAQVDAFVSLVQVSFPMAMVSSSIYDPLVGVKSQTDAKGFTTYFEYDKLQRLSNIKDKDNNIIKQYQYHYIGDPVPIVYYNVEKSQTFIRNNCTGGATGGNYAYVVAANSYSSTVSQLDADNQALADITLNGQNSANLNGSCIQPVVYAKLHHENPNSTASADRADVVVRFYLDAALTQPYAMPTTTIHYSVLEISATDSVSSSASKTGSGTSITLQSQAPLQLRDPFDRAIVLFDYTYQLFPSSAYIIVN